MDLLKKNYKLPLFVFLLWYCMQKSNYSYIYLLGSDGSPSGRMLEFAFQYLHLLFLYVLFLPVCLIFRNRKQDGGKHQILICAVFFLFTMGLLLAQWPGGYTWDDLHVVSHAQSFGVYSWQHFLSSAFMFLCLQTLPFCTGVLIIQVYLASLIVGYCVARIVRVLPIPEKRRIPAEILLTLPTLFPPMLSYLFSGFRMGIYSYLELLLICEWILLYRQRKLSWLHGLMISGLTVLVAAWRTEGIYYIPCFILFLLFLGPKAVKRWVAALLSLAVILSTSLIGKVNTFFSDPSMTYSLTATVLPVTELIRRADPVEDRQLLESLEPVANVQIIRQKTWMDGEALYWSTEFTPYWSTEEDFSRYLKGYAGLMLKYPDTALGSMWNTFLKASGVVVEDGVSLQRRNTGEYLFSGDSKEYWDQVDSLLKEPIHMGARKTVQDAIACTDSQGMVTPAYYFFWNLWIPLGLGVFSLVRALRRRDWMLCFLLLTVAARVPLVFATAPAPYIMYYLSVYLICYFLGLSSLMGLSLRDTPNMP